MSAFTSMNPEVPQTYMSNATSGIQQTVDIGKSLLLNSSDTNQFRNMNRMHDNYITTMQNQVVSSIVADALSDHSQLKYHEGYMLFTNHALRNAAKGSGQCAIYSLPNLNENLIKTHLYALNADKQNSMFNAVGLTGNKDYTLSGGAHLFNAVGEKRDFPMSPSHDMFPLTPAAAAQSITAIGVLYTDQTSGAKRGQNGITRRRQLGVVSHGRVTIPNLWGDLKVGDRVGFVFKMFNSSNIPALNSAGGLASMTNSTPGTFLQVRAHHEPYSTVPIRSSAYASPGPHDIDSWDLNARIQMREHGYTKNGDLDWLAMNGHQGRVSQTLSMPSYQEGYYIPLGTVFTMPKCPPLAMIERAHQTFDGYDELARYAPVDVIVSLTPINQVTVL